MEVLVLAGVALVLLLLRRGQDGGASQPAAPPAVYVSNAPPAIVPGLGNDGRVKQASGAAIAGAAVQETADRLKTTAELTIALGVKFGPVGVLIGFLAAQLINILKDAKQGGLQLDIKPFGIPWCPGFTDWDVDGAPVGAAGTTYVIVYVPGKDGVTPISLWFARADLEALFGGPDELAIARADGAVCWRPGEGSPFNKHLYEIAPWLREYENTHLHYVGEDYVSDTGTKYSFEALADLPDITDGDGATAIGNRWLHCWRRIAHNLATAGKSHISYGIPDPTVGWTLDSWLDNHFTLASSVGTWGGDGKPHQQWARSHYEWLISHLNGVVVRGGGGFLRTYQVFTPAPPQLYHGAPQIGVSYHLAAAPSAAHPAGAAVAIHAAPEVHGPPTHLPTPITARPAALARSATGKVSASAASSSGDIAPFGIRVWLPYVGTEFRGDEPIPHVVRDDKNRLTAGARVVECDTVQVNSADFAPVLGSNRAVAEALLAGTLLWHPQQGDAVRGVWEHIWDPLKSARKCAYWYGAEVA